MDSKGNCTVVFDDHGLGGDYDIFMRRVTAGGTMKPVVSLVDGLDDEVSPRIALDRSDSDFVLAYERVDGTSSQASLGEFSKAGDFRAAYSLDSGSDTGFSRSGVSIDGLDRYFVAYAWETLSIDYEIEGRFGVLG
jgi:hypothetical protein